MNTDIFSMNNLSTQEFPAAKAANQMEGNRDQFDSILKKQPTHTNESRQIKDDTSKKQEVATSDQTQKKVDSDTDEDTATSGHIPTNSADKSHLNNQLTTLEKAVAHATDQDDSAETTVPDETMTQAAQAYTLNPALDDTNKNGSTITSTSSIAGSLTSQPVKDLVNDQTLSLKGFELVDSEESPWNGKLLPASGKNTLINQSETTTLEYQQASTTTENTLLNSKSIDLQNKSLSFNQQLLNGETPTLFSQGAVTSTSISDENALSTLSNSLNPTTNLSTADKLMTNKAMSTVPTFNIATPFGSNEWHSEVNNRIRWMGKLNISSAELQLHPAELGAIEIKINTENDQTKVSFVSNNQSTRELLESTMPRLRELLADSGLQLEHSDVSEQSKTNHDALDNQDNLNSTENDSDIDEVNHSRISRFSHNQINHYV